MTKKDYELIAGTLRYCDAHCDSEEETALVAWVAEHLADTLARDNARFRKAQFMTASKVS